MCLHLLVICTKTFLPAKAVAMESVQQKEGQQHHVERIELIRNGKPCCKSSRAIPLRTTRCNLQIADSSSAIMKAKSGLTNLAGRPGTPCRSLNTIVRIRTAKSTINAHHFVWNWCTDTPSAPLDALLALLEAPAHSCKCQQTSSLQLWSDRPFIVDTTLHIFHHTCTEELVDRDSRKWVYQPG